VSSTLETLVDCHVTASPFSVKDISNRASRKRNKYTHLKTQARKTIINTDGQQLNKLNTHTFNRLQKRMFLFAKQGFLVDFLHDLWMELVDSSLTHFPGRFVVQKCMPSSTKIVNCVYARKPYTALYKSETVGLNKIRFLINLVHDVVGVYRFISLVVIITCKIFTINLRSSVGLQSPIFSGE